MLIEWVSFTKINGWYYTGTNNGDPHDLLYDDVNELYVVGGNNVNTATLINSIVVSAFDAITGVVAYH
jgi:hypothetical protein